MTAFFTDCMPSAPHSCSIGDMFPDARFVYHASQTPHMQHRDYAG